MLAVSVRDEGIGLSPESMRSLFRPFYQVRDHTLSRLRSSSTHKKVSRNSTEGSGLGLYICRELVNLMRGHICCQSELGNGSTFSFAVPMEEASISDDQTSQVNSNEVAAKVISNYRLLVAEDNRVNQMVISNMLTKLGCTFDLADNGEVACKLFDEVCAHFILQTY
jgi:CheY-like chemotaxis protein